MLKEKIKELIKSYNFWIIFILIWSILILLLQLTLIDQIFWPKIFGSEEISIFDNPWSIRHLLMGITVVFILINLKTNFLKNKKILIIFILLITLSWEFIELIMEYNNFGYIVGQEHWSNRVIGDPIMNVVGGLLGYTAKKLNKI